MFENLQALAELAKAGYKPNDIKELLELNSLQPAPAQGEQGTPTDSHTADCSDLITPVLP